MTTSDDSAEPATPSSPALSPIGWRQLLFAPVVGLLLGGVLVVAFSAAWLLIVLRGAGAFDVARATALLQGNFYANMMTVAGLYIPAIWLLWRAAKKLTPPPAARFFAPVSRITGLLGLATGVVASLACLAFEDFLTRTFGISFDLTAAEHGMFPVAAVQLAVAVAVMGFVGPFAEELYFRGFLLGWLRQRMGTLPAVALSALVFALTHLFMLMHPGASGWITTGEIFGVGILMGLWVVRTGSLWSSFAVHIGYNCVVVLQLYLSPA
jgi:membrane protease YdiL (CAAX protease family)